MCLDGIHVLCRWAYTGIQGALTFCQDKVKGGLWFRVVDLIVSAPPLYLSRRVFSSSLYKLGSLIRLAT